MLSITTITVLSYQRYNMVTMDRQFPVYSQLSSVLTLFSIWTYAFLVASPPLAGWGMFGRNGLENRWG